MSQGQDRSVGNPYYDECLRLGLGNDQYSFQMETYTKRREMTKKYAWSIPCPKALSVLEEYLPIVEMGAGRGYWASLVDGDIVAYDTFAESDLHYLGGNKENLWFPVQTGGLEKLADHPDRTLFLCWPPYDTPMGGDILRAFTGKYFIHVGEWDGGCTGGDCYWKQIEEEWEEIRSVDLIQWSGIHDNLYVFERKVLNGR